MRRGPRFRANTTQYGPYLSPFYSPELFGSSPHSWFGPQPAAWPAWLPFSPALLILPIPAFFRFTCYYYRGAYYKAFWADPPSCTVGEPRSCYRGETFVPARAAERPSLHALHFVAVLLVLVIDVWKAFWFANPGDRPGVVRRRRRHALSWLLNAVLLSGYPFGCHSMRHVVGGCVDRAFAGAARV